jgi:hypothetical protein
MTIRRKMVLPVALAIGVLGTMLVAQIAGATHARPKGATPLRVSTVVAYKACTTGANRTHGTPLAAPSCNPPVQASSFLTVGTGDAWSVGFVRLDVKTTSPEDVNIVASITDVRCKGATAVAGFCGTANSDNASVPDYSGQLNGTAQIRITDHYNGLDPGGAGGADPATVADLPFPVETTCTPTPADGTVGSTCSVSTTANGVLGGSVQDNKRANVEVQTINIQDGGADGTAASPPNTTFETQGIWIP